MPDGAPFANDPCPLDALYESFALPPSNDPLAREALRHLPAFLASHAQSSTHGASREMHLSQPAVSKQLKNFETWFGDDLFKRTPDGLQPSSVADEIYAKASAFVAWFDETQRRHRWRQAIATRGRD